MKRGDIIAIKSCTDPSMWYIHKIGQSFKVIGVDNTGVWVRTGDCWNTSNFIRPVDATTEIKKSAHITT